MVADIEKMYRQIKVAEKEVALWKDDPKLRISEFKLTP